MEQNAEEVIVYNGSHNTYADIAKRGSERLALSVQYAVHPNSGVGFLLIRFIAHDPAGVYGDYKWMAQRDGEAEAEMKTLDGHAINCKRLTKIGLGVFAPGPLPMVFLAMCDKYIIWEQVADWLKGQAESEGFSMLSLEGGFPALVRDLVGGKYEANDENYKLVIEFPDLTQGVK